MANNTISKIEISGTTYDICDASTRATVDNLKTRVTTLEGFVKHNDSATYYYGISGTRSYNAAACCVGDDSFLSVEAENNGNILRLEQDSIEAGINFQMVYNQSTRTFGLREKSGNFDTGIIPLRKLQPEITNTLTTNSFGRINLGLSLTDHVVLGIQHNATSPQYAFIPTVIGNN